MTERERDESQPNADPANPEVERSHRGPAPEPKDARTPTDGPSLMRSGNWTPARKMSCSVVPEPSRWCATGVCCPPSVPGRNGGEDAVEDRSQERRKHIFAINGSPDFLNVIRDLFQDEGYNVTTTNFVPNSFEQIAALDPDALIVDIVVGQRAGWELLEQINAAAVTTGIPVLIVSTDPRLLDRAQDQAARYGKNRHLIKPFGLDDILEQIREMIGTA